MIVGRTARSAPSCDRKGLDMSKSHPQQWAIEENIARPVSQDVTALGRFPTTQIADSGAPVSVVDPPIRRLAGDSEICGPATTLWTKPGDILFILKSPDVIKSGDVLIIDGGGRGDAAVMGDIVSRCLAYFGCRGIVVDGAIRDIDGINEIGLPVFGRNVYPTTASVDGPGAINVPIQCGGVMVYPGDVVRADASGVVIVPGDRVSEVIAATQAVENQETAWRSAVANGTSLSVATGINAKLSTK